ncbi:hypothetical protein CERSUDRAFT_90999 [Gelatoporia subvermispora B]|uniref:PLD phosphodiesterase domain-containing protein n=1 Tax=Ceriporiopsis subvermispora (strain B) TaxID=914234 RepID=M2R773_CERS8|nr:hypothetical protein CERSUDRAFT_90999 [Gelatoporia subvermispora B]
MVSQHVWDLTHSDKTLVQALAANPSAAPQELGKSLYAHHHHGAHHQPNAAGSGGIIGTVKGLFKNGKTPSTEPIAPQDEEPTQEDLDRAAECGKFGSRPSDLFLKIYHEVLKTLDHDPWAGVVSPPLLGTRGVVPLSIISVIPDIVQHHYDLIVRARHEVFLATNFWEASNSASKVCDALRELSRRAQQRGERVVVKMMYDRANLKMITESHLYVKEAEWTKPEVALPKESEIPGVELEVVNFHQPMLGTFHSKFLIVDRAVALVCSNNIQDRCNMEMMMHLEGPVVDGLYDMALISWAKAMHPPLPLLGKPHEVEDGYKFGVDNPWMTCHVLDGRNGLDVFRKMKEEGRLEGDVSPDADRDPGDGTPFIAGRFQSITDHLNTNTQSTEATLPEDHGATSSDDFTPHVVHAQHGEVPMAIVNRPPCGKPGNDLKSLLTPQDAAWLGGLRHAQQKVFIQTPTFCAAPVVDAVLAAVRRGIEVTLYVDVGFNDGGEALPLQGGTNEEVVRKMYAELQEEEKERLKYYWYTGKDQIKPINAHLQQRNCHVKLMIIDDMVGIAGNGNQDTQSWFHSAECNVMIDSPAICAEWFGTIERVQNTHFHRVGHDGVWRDAQGAVLTDGTGVTSGVRGVVKGVQGSIARVRGKGGF